MKKTLLWFFACSTIYIVLMFYMEKEMSTQSSVLAWRIPGMGEPGGLPSMGSHRVRHNWSDLAAAAAAMFYYLYKLGNSFCFIDCVDKKPLTVWITTTWKILKEKGIPDHLTCLLRNLLQVSKQQLKLDMEQQTGSKLGKEYIKAA